MNTCKATLRVLAAHKLYLIIYLVLLGIMMFSLSWSTLSANASSASAGADAAPTYDPGRPVVAVVDRDANRGGIAEGMRAYLAASSTLTDLEDDPESLQQAVASHWADLIVIIPDGFAQGLLDSAGTGEQTGAASQTGEQVRVETVTSYTSGAGSMAGMNVDGFLALTRTALVGSLVQVDVPESVLDGIRAGLASQQNGSGNAGNAGVTGAAGSTGTSESAMPSQDALAAAPKDSLRTPTFDDLAKATDRAVASSRDAGVNPPIAVTDAPAETDAGTASGNAEAAASGFGNTMKTALYPLFLAMSVCSSIILGAFTAGEVRRRLIASPGHMGAMALQRAAALCGFALVVCAGYLAVTFGLMLAAGLAPSALPAGGVAMTFCAACVYALMTVACGFMLSECGASEVAANGFANVFGLAIMFTSGIAIPLDMVPEAMLTLAKLLPGWWYCEAINQALGIGSASESGVSVTGWLGGLALVALFAAAFVSIGLAVGRIRRARPARPARAAVAAPDAAR